MRLFSRGLVICGICVVLIAAGAAVWLLLFQPAPAAISTRQMPQITRPREKRRMILGGF